MPDTNPQESADAEGLPDGEDHPPGVDVELDEETMMVPREYPVASGLDPAYSVTDAESRLPESVADRADREIPDVGSEEIGVGGGTGGADHRRIEAGEAYVVGAFSAGTEAGAVPVDEPLAPSLDDEVAVTTRGRPEAELLEPGPDGELDADDEPEAVALGAEDADVGLPAEEDAVHAVDDDRAG